VGRRERAPSDLRAEPCSAQRNPLTVPLCGPGPDRKRILRPVKNLTVVRRSAARKRGCPCGQPLSFAAGIEDSEVEAESETDLAAAWKASALVVSRIRRDLRDQLFVVEAPREELLLGDRQILGVADRPVTDRGVFVEEVEDVHEQLNVAAADPEAMGEREVGLGEGGRPSQVSAPVRREEVVDGNERDLRFRSARTDVLVHRDHQSATGTGT
jgi:hypothetical protein